MSSDLFWLFGLLILEAAVFLFVLYLARRFTRSLDREWPAEAVPAALDGHAGPMREPQQVVAGEGGSAAAS